MSINEELLDELMNTVTGGSPTDFAEALDKAMKVKCADGIDARRTELAGGIHESKDEDESYDDEEEEEELDEAADVDGKDNDDKEDDGDGLDDVGDEDSDVDNDGDSDSSDEYLTKRRKAIQKDVRSESRQTIAEARNFLGLDEAKAMSPADKKEYEALKRTLVSFENDLKKSAGGGKTSLLKGIKDVKADINNLEKQYGIGDKKEFAWKGQDTQRGIGQRG